MTLTIWSRDKDAIPQVKEVLTSDNAASEYIERHILVGDDWVTPEDGDKYLQAVHDRYKGGSYSWTALDEGDGDNG